MRANERCVQAIMLRDMESAEIVFGAQNLDGAVDMSPR
jgi:hypothetical protein